MSVIRPNGLWVQQSEEVHTEEGKGEEELTQTALRDLENRRKTEGANQFSEDLQTLLFSQLCLAAL